MDEDGSNEDFWHGIYEERWGEYVDNCEHSGVRPSYSDFQVWCEEHSLVPEPIND